MTDPQSGWAAPGQPPPSSPSGEGGPPSPPPPAAARPTAPKPGVIPLRPLGVGEILDGAISYIRANPVATLALSAVVIAVAELVQLPAQYLLQANLPQLDSAEALSVSDFSDAIGGAFAAFLVAGLVSFVAVTVLTGLLIVVLSRAVLGQRSTLQQAWKAASPRLPGLLGISLLITVLLIAVLLMGGISVAVVIAAGQFGLPAVLVGLVVFALIVLTVGLIVYLWVALAMATPAYVLEGIGVLAALSRSRRLVQPAWWRIFGILALATVLTWFISLIITFPFGIAGGIIDGSFAADAAVFGPISVTALLLGALGAIIAGTITTPFAAGVIGLLYVDQRIRREAWDLELTRASYGAPPTAGPPPTPAW